MAGVDHKNVNRQAVAAGLPALLTRLWRFAMVLSRDPDTADELVQATCVRALEKFEQFEPGSSLDRWTFRILSSIWSNELRSRKVRLGQGHVDAELVLVSRDDREMETKILAAQVLKEIAALPEAQSAAVLLVYGEGLKCREAAEILDVPEGTVMSRLAAARAALGHLGETKKQARPTEDKRHRKAR